VNGILVPPADVNRLATEIMYLLAHPEKANEMGKQARETIIGDFDIRKIAGKYILLYQELLNNEK
jgi:glycosyltransferase involved in cell wall biosynthesis